MKARRSLLVGLAALAASTGPVAVPLDNDRRAAGAALGIFLGQPTGLSLRIGLGAEQSFEAKAAWDLTSYGGDPIFGFQASGGVGLRYRFM